MEFLSRDCIKERVQDSCTCIQKRSIVHRFVQAELCTNQAPEDEDDAEDFYNVMTTVMRMRVTLKLMNLFKSIMLISSHFQADCPAEIFIQTVDTLNPFLIPTNKPS